MKDIKKEDTKQGGNDQAVGQVTESAPETLQAESDTVETVRDGIQVVAWRRTIDGTGWSAVVDGHDLDGNSRQIVIPRRLLGREKKVG